MDFSGSVPSYFAQFYQTLESFEVSRRDAPECSSYERYSARWHHFLRGVSNTFNNIELINQANLAASSVSALSSSNLIPYTSNRSQVVLVYNTVMGHFKQSRTYFL